MNRLAAWYRDPEQELLRREVAWLFHWMTHWPGVSWTVAFVAVNLANFIIGIGDLAGRNWWGLDFFVRGAAGALWFVEFGLFLWFISRRTLAPFQRIMLPHLWLTRLRPKNFWPALLAAPILFTEITALGALLCSIPESIETIRSASDGTLFTQPAPVGAGPGPGPTVQVGAGDFMTPTYFMLTMVFSVLMAFTFSPALAIYIAWRCQFRDAGFAGVFMSFVLGVIICVLPAILLITAGFAVLAYSGVGWGAFPLQFWLQSIPLILMAVPMGVSLLLGAIGYRKLLHPSQWERLRMEAERMA